MRPTRSSRPDRRTLSLIGLVLLGTAACSDVTVPGEPSRSLVSTTLVSAKAPRVAICHVTGDGSFQLLEVNGNAVDAHRSHGDALPGEDVPGMAGYQFSSACVPEVVARDLTGVWEGTYTWNCGGARTGSTPIRFEVVDLHNGRIAGTVSYLGGSAPLTDSDRMSDPFFRANGTLLGGTLDPNGMTIRLITNGDAGQFVNNEFDGTISANLRSISGGTLNGDSATPTSNGCSAGVGYSGTFSLTRVS
jgi:hypothetical protein